MLSKKRKASDMLDENTNNHHAECPLNNVSDSNGVDYTTRHVQMWNKEDVVDYLRRKGQSDAATIFLDNNISGDKLLNITESDLSQMGISKEDHSTLLQTIQEIHKFKVPVTYKVFNDSIHGHIELHPLCVKIIDTPQFQRLRFIKQLGACYFVFPGAPHNRFEHSLGVCHLAGKRLRAIQERQPELNITKQDILCAEIAGLCHDLGHGPFSHLFDMKFMPLVKPGNKWTHELASLAMLDHLLATNGLDEAFTEYGLTPTDKVFIKELIAGPLEHNMEESIDQSWPYKGRSKNKGFLYEIVANKRNGIDVDKWDYFARDCHMLGIKNNFDHKRLIKFARVLEVDNELQICYRDKEVYNLYDMFNTRLTLHRRAYQHRVCRIIEIMITEALEKADAVLKFPGKKGQLRQMSEAVDDMVAYELLTDDVFGQIQRSVQPELQASKEIIRKILCRDLYKFIGQTRINSDDPDLEKDKPSIIRGILKAGEANEDTVLTENDVIIDIVKMNFGMDTKNPIDNVRFYEKKNPDKPVIVRKEEVSQMLPVKFDDRYLRLYCKKKDQASLHILEKKFRCWCQEKKFSMPRGGSFEMTPYKAQDQQGGTPHKDSDLTQINVATSDKAKQNLQF